jgi:hypothetical protein
MTGLPRDYDAWRLASPSDDEIDEGAEEQAREDAEERGDWLYQQKRDREINQ